MKSVNDILHAKEGSVWFVDAETSVFDALKMMAEKNVGALMVTQDQKITGIISERDYARKIILQDLASKSTPVKDIMTTKVVSVRPEQSIEECMVLMTKKHVRHLPVYEGEILCGIISIGDIVKAISDEKDYHISQLENYIMGKLTV